MGIMAAMAVPHPPLIIPEVGRGQERGIAKTVEAYEKVMARAAALQPDLVIVVSPHSVMYADYCHISPGTGAAGDFGRFGAPAVKVSAAYDAEFVAALSEACAAADIPAGTLGEKNPALDHGTMIPLYFLQKHWQRFQAVRIGIGGVPAREHYRLGQQLAAVAERLGRRAVLVASGDWSHKLKADGPYGFAAEGPVLDEKLAKDLGAADFLSLLTTPAELAEKAAECGLRAFWILAGTMDRRQVKAELLSYEGPFGVGYGVAFFWPGGADASRAIGEQLVRQEQAELARCRAQEDAWVRLARHSLETYVKTKSYASLPEDLPAEILSGHAGAFVSIHKDGALRGCIGTILPVRANLAEEILYNAVSAGTRDPRFAAVQPAELDQLVYKVDVLTEPEPIASSAELDVKRYGVIVQCGERRGLLLPDLDGVDTVEQQLAIARRKGNIGEEEACQLWRFEVVRHH